MNFVAGSFFITLAIAKSSTLNELYNTSRKGAKLAKIFLFYRDLTVRSDSEGGGRVQPFMGMRGPAGPRGVRLFDVTLILK